MKLLSDKDYDFVFKNTPRICIDLLIKSKEGILLGKRTIQPYKNKYSLPGGRIGFRETIEKAIQRIALNEIGCSVKVCRMIGVVEFLNEMQISSKRHSISIVFHCTPLCKVFTETNQTSEFKYFNKSDNKVHPVHLKWLIKNKFIINGVR